MDVSEVPYRLFFESTSDAAFIFPFVDGKLGTFIDANKGASELLGYSREELLNWSQAELFSETVDLNHWQSVLRQLEEHGVARFDPLLATADGQEVPVELSLRLFWQDTERRVLCIARDLSERRLHERILRERQRDLSALINASEHFAALVMPDTQVIQINKAGAERFGLPQEQVIGRRILDLGPDTLRQARVDIARKVVDNNESIIFDDFRDGMHLHHTVSPVSDDQGRVTRFAIFSTDHTEQVLRQAVDGLLALVDQRILEGNSFATLMAESCAALQQAFQSPVVWYSPAMDSDAPSGFFAEGPLADTLREGSRLRDWSRPSLCTQTEPRVMDVTDNDEPEAQPLFDTLHKQDVQAVATIPIVAGEQCDGVIVVSSEFPVLLERAVSLDLFRQVSRRLSVALQKVQDQQQLMLLRRALESSGNAMYICNAEGVITWANRAFAESCGFSEQDVIGKTPALLNAGASDPDFEQTIWTTVASGAPWSGELQGQRQDGSDYTVLQTVTPVMAGTEKPNHFITVREDISARKRNEEQIRFLAEHCPLTGLFNRHYLMTTLEDFRALVRNGRSSDGVALLYLDIDHFKKINDQHGHEVGDGLLKAFARRLMTAVRTDDVVSRLGGDEFVVMLRHIPDIETASAVAQKILDTCEEPLDCDGQAFRVSSSIGIAFSLPQQDWLAADLLRHADSAMYQAKAAGRNRYSVFE